MFSDRRLATAIFLSIALAPAIAHAVIPVYEEEQREARQEPWIEAEALRFDPQFDFTGEDENEAVKQATAIMAELEAQDRQLSGPGWGDATPAELDGHMLNLLTRISELHGLDACAVSAPPCVSNEVLVRFAAFYTAHALSKYGGVVQWGQPTRDAALSLYRDPNWNQSVLILLNSTIPLVGMRILGGWALRSEPGGLELFERGRAEYYFAHAQAIRRGLLEPMSGHYAGETLNKLALLVDALKAEAEANSEPDPTLQAKLQDLSEQAESFLMLSLLVPGHHYHPGGGLGAPQDRASLGGVSDNDPTHPPNLVPVIDVLINDDLVSDSIVEHAAELVVISFEVPEAVRSIFLDKGNGYSFSRRGVILWTVSLGAPHLSAKPPNVWDPAPYALGFSASEDGTPPTPMQVNPIHGVMLPGGSASMGLSYGAGANPELSSGVYIRDTAGVVGGPTELGFSILYHHQPRHPWPYDIEPPYEPLVDDPTWEFERKSPYRRMMFGRTSITLFDATYDPQPLEDPGLEYTMVHLPDFTDPLVGALEDPQDPDLGGRARSCHGWRVGETADALLAFHPLGEIEAEATMGLQGTDPRWIYLELDELDSQPETNNMTGNITEIRPVSDFAGGPELPIDNYCDELDELGPRAVTFDPVAKTASILTTDPDTGSPVTMTLGYDDTRSLDYGGGAILQADDDFLDQGLIHSEWIGETNPVVSFDDETLTLTVQRTEYGGSWSLGVAGAPTVPGEMRPNFKFTTPTQTKIEWGSGRSWDDGGIARYHVWAGEPSLPPPAPGAPQGNYLGSIDETDVCFPSCFVHVFDAAEIASGFSRCALQAQTPTPPETVHYAAMAEDDEGNFSVAAGRIDVPEDNRPPDTPVLAKDERPAEIELSWAKPEEACGIFLYQVLRAEEPEGPLTLLANVSDNSEVVTFTDTPPDPLADYRYVVRAVDTAPNWSADGEITAHLNDTQAPSAPPSVTYYPSSNVFIYWAAGVDDVAVAGYEVRRTDDAVPVPQQESFYVNAPTLFLYDPSPGSGTWTYDVRTVDTSGHQSPYSQAVTVVVP